MEMGSGGYVQMGVGWGRVSQSGNVLRAEAAKAIRRPKWQNG